jgi:hypothetical protein
VCIARATKPPYGHRRPPAKDEQLETPLVCVATFAPIAIGFRVQRVHLP